jgi:hypothetical protein
MSEALPDNVQAVLRSGNKIEAIKLLREQTGLGLKEAKDWVEAVQAGKPRPAPASDRSAVDRRNKDGISQGLMRLYRQISFVLFVAFFWVLLSPGLSFTEAGAWIDRQLDSARAFITQQPDTDTTPITPGERAQTQEDN